MSGFFSKIPITIHVSFWLFAGLLGFLIDQSVMGIIKWILIIFFSVLFHEYGHATLSLLFGQKPRIELIAMGGVTYPSGPKLSLPKEFLVVLAGPAAGFCLYLISAFLVARFHFSPGLTVILSDLRNVNLYWTIINLLPVAPLDGGQLLRILFEAFWGVRGVRASFLCGAVIAVLASLFFFSTGSLLVGGIFFLFAFQSFDLWRKSKTFESIDQDHSLKQMFKRAERVFQQGRDEDAHLLFEKIISQTKKGLFYNKAKEYQALIKERKGETKMAYEMLLPMKESLSFTGLCLLQKLAFDQKNDQLVLEISGRCFQNDPSSDLAFRTAEAAARLHKVKEAIGWLEAGEREGHSLKEVLTLSSFDEIREDPLFKKFLRTIENS